jgi:molecular chaperone GrpE
MFLPVARRVTICYFFHLLMFGRKKSMSKNENEAPPAATTPHEVETVPLSPEQIEDLKTRAAKADENWDRLLRTTADFENFKKRAAREKIESAQYATFSLLQKLLPILDNFEMALAAAKTATAPRPGAAAAEDNRLGSMQSGVLMIQQQLKSALVETGLEEIDATGKPFDPNFHEAISQQESATVPDGHVLQQMRKGYKFKDRLLRPATVVVAKKPLSAPAPKAA